MDLNFGNLRQRNLKPGQERSPEGVARRGGEHGLTPQSPGSPFPDLDGLPVRIDHPVLPDPEALVELALHEGVEMAGRLGEDLDDQVRCALDVPLFDDRGSLPGDEEEIGLDNVVGREDDIGRSDEEVAETTGLNQPSKPKSEADDELLVPQERGRGREMLSVDDLMTLPVVRKADVIVVGQLRGRVVESHEEAFSNEVRVARPSHRTWFQ
jgi:hypothetical protein